MTHLIGLRQTGAVDFRGLTGGTWVLRADGLRLKYPDLSAAYDGANSGGVVRVYPGTYKILSSFTIAKTVTFEGDGPEATILQGDISNAPVFDIDANSITVVFRNITIQHIGGGVAATGIFSNNSGVNVIFDNARLEITTGGGTDSRGLWVEAGTWTLLNGSKITVTSGTNKYGIYNDVGAATITIGAGCEVSGATDDIYGDQAGSSILLNGAILGNNLISWAGTAVGSYHDSTGSLFYIDTGISATQFDLPLIAGAAATDAYANASVSDSDFVATINGAPSGTSVVYNAPSSGAENNLVPSATNQLAKMVLHNTTRSNSALISNCNTGTNTITLTATVPANWANGDTITIRSQTNTTNPSGGAYFVDFEFTSGVDTYTRL